MKDLKIIELRMRKTAHVMHVVGNNFSGAGVITDGTVLPGTPGGQ